MRAMLVLAFVGIALALFKGSHATILCYVGQQSPTGHQIATECYAGSCAKRMVSGTMQYACWYKHYPTGCRMIGSMRVCFCNYPLCNTGGMPQTDQRVYKQGNTLSDWFNFEEMGDDV